MKKLLFIPMLFACFMSMGQASAGGGGGKHFIGEKFGGGIVFHVKDGHGLIAETQDQTNYCELYNAQKIIRTTANHSAAGALFTDWRLPTKYELNLLYLQKSVVGGFVDREYWSSTDPDNKEKSSFKVLAWAQSFFNGYQAIGTRGSVRAIRAF
jgi:hypothetical protein